MMMGFRLSGPLCATTSPLLDKGTLNPWYTPPPGPVCAVPALQQARQWHHESQAGGFPASALTMSPEAVALLKSIEALRLKPYDDQTGGQIEEWVKGATIGYGHLIAKSEWATYEDGLTREEADALFLADAAPFEQAVGKTITVGVQQYEFDAMVILAFNIGKSGFHDSTIAGMINSYTPGQSLKPLEQAWKAWNKSQGKVSKGLVNRRAAEWRIYTSAAYALW